MRTTNPQRLLAYALVAIGVIMLLSRIGGADWLWLALLSAIFLVAYVSRENYNFLVAGGVLMGIAVGTLIGTQSGMLLSLAAGFFAIDRVEPKPNRWALYSAGIFAVLGALVALGSFGLLGSVGFALALIAAGVYLLYRGDSRPDQPTYTNSDAPTRTVAPAPAPQPTQATAPTAAQTTTPTPSPPPAAEPARPTDGADTRSAPSPGNAAPYAAAETSGPPIPEPPVLSAEAETRLRRLEAWRRETAKTEGIPPYIVFSNDTLAKIAAANPQTLTDLDTVKGVGPVKLSRYGETVLNVLRGDLRGTPETAAS